jgi:hypothetical protein
VVGTDREITEVYNIEQIQGRHELTDGYFGLWPQGGLRIL